MTNKVHRWFGQIAVAAALACAGSVASAAIVYRNGVIDSGDATLGATGESNAPASITTARSNFINGTGSVNGLVPVPHQEHFFKSDLAGSTDLSNILGGMGSISGVTLDNTPFDQAIPPNFNGRWDTSDAADEPSKTWVEFSGEVTIMLNASFNAFAFSMTDAGDISDPATVNIDFYDANDLLVGTSLVGPGDTNSVSAASGFSRVLFFGVHTSDSFSKVVLRTSQTAGDPDDYDFIGLDDLIVGNVQRGGSVPEPGTLAIAGLGLLLASRIKRRR